MVLLNSQLWPSLDKQKVALIASSPNLETQLNNKAYIWRHN